VGKELLARAIHAISRPGGPFVAVNVAGLDDIVFSDTLFGHSKGAFTGAHSIRPGLVEKAAGGSLFLDEIGDLSHTSQVKLLRLIQEREYMSLGSDSARPAEIRILAATHCDIEDAVAEGRFRKDLYFRLNTHRIHIPPLRERLEDIPPLLNQWDGLARKNRACIGKH
jgi:transcriptional regulator with PAS, ATPase and Fis domain